MEKTPANGSLNIAQYASDAMLVVNAIGIIILIIIVTKIYIAHMHDGKTNRLIESVAHKNV